jgi:hypothetical protein
MSIEEKVGKLQGHVEDIKENVAAIFKKIDKINTNIDDKLTDINKQHDYEQTQTNEFLKSINLKVGEIDHPCTDVEIIKDKVKTHLEGHKEKQRNNLTKAGLFAGFITLILHFLGFIWDKLVKLFVSY